MKKLTAEEERQLLDECINNNRCDRLVEQYGGLIYSTVRRVFLIRGAALLKEDLEEAHQDVFLHIFDKDCKPLRLYREGEGYSLGRWIRRIASNSAKNYLRKKGFDSPFGRSRGEELDYGKLVGPEFPELDSIKKLSLVKGLKTLPLMDRITKEIAVIIESTESSVYNRVYKIKERLGKFMKEQRDSDIR